MILQEPRKKNTTQLFPCSQLGKQTFRDTSAKKGQLMTLQLVSKATVLLLYQTNKETNTPGYTSRPARCVSSEKCTLSADFQGCWWGLKNWIWDVRTLLPQHSVYCALQLTPIRGNYVFKFLHTTMTIYYKHLHGSVESVKHEEPVQVNHSKGWIV